MSPWDIPFCRRKSRIVLPMLFEMDFTGALACAGRNVVISAISGTVICAPIASKPKLLTRHGFPYPLRFPCRLWFTRATLQPALEHEDPLAPGEPLAP